MALETIEEIEQAISHLARSNWRRCTGGSIGTIRSRSMSGLSLISQPGALTMRLTAPKGTELAFALGDFSRLVVEQTGKFAASVYDALNANCTLNDPEQNGIAARECHAGVLANFGPEPV